MNLYYKWSTVKIICVLLKTSVGLQVSFIQVFFLFFLFYSTCTKFKIQSYQIKMAPLKMVQKQNKQKKSIKQINKERNKTKQIDSTPKNRKIRYSILSECLHCKLTLVPHKYRGLLHLDRQWNHLFNLFTMLTFKLFQLCGLVDHIPSCH